jgi:hypothetical protein
MAATNIGDLRVTFERGVLTITPHGRSESAITLDEDGVEKLIDLVCGHDESESNQRQAFRVSLWDSSGLTTTVRHGECEIEATPKSISLSGVFVELPDPPGIELPVGAQVEVTLELDTDHETLEAIVRRRHDSGCGLFFPASMKDEELDPPATLARIVMTLQRRWLARRIRSGW